MRSRGDVTCTHSFLLKSAFFMRALTYWLSAPLYCEPFPGTAHAHRTRQRIWRGSPSSGDARTHTRAGRGALPRLPRPFMTIGDARKHRDGVLVRTPSGVHADAHAASSIHPAATCLPWTAMNFPIRPDLVGREAPLGPFRAGRRKNNRRAFCIVR